MDRTEKAAYYFILPLAVFLAVFVLLPAAGTFLNSFYKDITFSGRQFIFLDNFTELMHNPGFIRSVKFTLLFTAIAVPIEIILGIIIALIINEKIPGRGLLRAAVLIPWAIPAAVSARAWELIYNYSYGLANFILLHTGLAESPVNFLGTGAGAFSALVIADAWKTAPFAAIIVLAGLQAVPGEIYSQAKVDRTNFIQRFFLITLPLIRTVIIVALLFRTIDTLRIFDLIYVLTGGGPGGLTESLSMYAYSYYLSGDFGMGSAVSVILFITALVLSLFYIKTGKFIEGPA